MGCACSTPAVAADGVGSSSPRGTHQRSRTAGALAAPAAAQSQPGSGGAASLQSSKARVGSSPQHPAADIPAFVGLGPRQQHAAATPVAHAQPAHQARPLRPEQLLALASALLSEEPGLAAVCSPLMLASLCLIESGGAPNARAWRDSLGDWAIGVCQVPLGTARYLAASHGFDRFGTHPGPRELDCPKACAYFAAARLSLLVQHAGLRRSEGWVVRAYHAGPKGVVWKAAGTQLTKYCKAKLCLTEVAHAMLATVAAGAAAAGLGPPRCLQQAALTPAAPAVGSPAKDAPGWSPRKQHGQQQLELASSWDGLPGRDQAPTALAASPRKSGNSSGAGGSGGADQLVQLFAPAASLVQVLASSWGEGSEPQAGPPGNEQASAPRGLLAALQAHVKQQGASGPCEAAGPQQPWPSSAGAARGRQGSVLCLVPVSRAAVDAALWRLALILGPAAVADACSSAATAAALRTASAASQPPAARGSRHARSGSGGQAAQAAALLARLPCALHIVKQGETLEQVAAAAGVSTDDLLAANQELAAAAAAAAAGSEAGGGVAGAAPGAGELQPQLQAHDCIALPLPRVPPRLVVLQPGDTPAAVAVKHRLTQARLFAANPELAADPSRAQPGWVVRLPGLRGDSRAGPSLDALAAAASAADSRSLEGAWGSASGLADACAAGAWGQAPGGPHCGGPMPAGQQPAGGVAIVSRAGGVAAPAAPGLQPLGSGAYLFAVPGSGSASSAQAGALDDCAWGHCHGSSRHHHHHHHHHQQQHHVHGFAGHHSHSSSGGRVSANAGMAVRMERLVLR